MKKTVYYFIAILFLCFILPALLTNTKTKQSSNDEIVNNEDNSMINAKENGYTYNKYGVIKLLHKKTNEVEEVEIDKYLCNVVAAEMPVDFEKEALKAQAIVARTYTIYKINNRKHDNADICDDSTCCQAWVDKEERFKRWESDVENKWNKIEQCVDETKGKIITYQNQPINAFFHSNSGGKTELPTDVWGGNSSIPYLQVVETAGEEGYKQYSSEVEITNQELLDKLKQKYSDIQIDFSNAEDIKILEYTSSGRVKTIKFGNHNLSGTEVRSLLSLKSTNFEIEKQEEKIKFIVKGYGHGVGMSQTGADSMAKSGSTAEEIIKHFYTGVELTDVNSI